ncbi:MAG: Eco47II family restriction endonuclease [Symploca sp. SIO3E6]|nr:Eco47II family restriction endonuclease [Caldora sp. SIO3E6]
MSYLPYISDNDLKAVVKTVVDSIIQAQARAEERMYDNVIDPFSAIFDGAVQNLNLEDWLVQENARQIQKTVQNKIGEFHQNILGSIPGWVTLPQGLDICNTNRKIFAEIKNKYNTVKGSDKVGIYDYLSLHLQKPEYQNFTAYYVEIIPQNKKNYNKPFTPSDRTTGTNRPLNEKIRQISGQAFYALATGEPQALRMLFDVLPDVIANVSGSTKLNDKQQASFRTLFERAY